MFQPNAPTIVVVDDADIVRKSAARCLRRKGYIVLEASNASEALALAAHNAGQINLVLTDLVLPVMGGVELAAEVRRRLPSVGIAYMTGHLGTSARCETLPQSETPVLIKPFTPRQLEDRVREALSLTGWNGPLQSPDTGTPGSWDAH